MTGTRGKFQSRAVSASFDLSLERIAKLAGWRVDCRGQEQEEEHQREGYTSSPGDRPAGLAQGGILTAVRLGL